MTSWNAIEAHANWGQSCLLSPDHCRTLVDWHNQIVGEKNRLVLENHELVRRTLELEITISQLQNKECP